MHNGKGGGGGGGGDVAGGRVGGAKQTQQQAKTDRHLQVIRTLEGKLLHSSQTLPTTTQDYALFFKLTCNKTGAGGGGGGEKKKKAGAAAERSNLATNLMTGRWLEGGKSCSVMRCETADVATDDYEFRTTPRGRRRSHKETIKTNAG